MRSKGHSVSGSDRSASVVTDDLVAQGIPVSFLQDGSAIPKDCDVLVYSEAVPESSPERTLARERGIRQLSYPQALGELSRGYDVIAVAGTHGKSSTTAMAARLLLTMGKDPTVVVGTRTHELSERNWRAGESSLFLLEACEYRRSFLAYDPRIVLLTTCDGDHFDYFTSQEDYEQAFLEFLSRLPQDGIVITHGSDPRVCSVVERSGRKLIDADHFPLISLGTPGLHMRQNAQLVLALAAQLGLPPADAQEAIAGYSGSWRRMEEKGTNREGVTVIDDYAHHPAEIRATLSGIKEAYPGRRIVCAFQPHTHDRTLKLYTEFLPAFRDADLVIVPDVYAARSERDGAQVNVASFAADIAKGSGIEAVDGESLEKTEHRLRTDILKRGDVLVCMGAGDITNLAGRMVR